MKRIQNGRIDNATWLQLLLLGLLWGGSFFFARIAVQEIPPVTLVLLRLMLAALALNVVMTGGGERQGIGIRSRWRAFLVLGLINNALPHTLIFIGQTEIGAGLASILNATTPIFTVIIANRLTADEKLTREKLAGCLAGLAGAALLLAPGIAATAAIPFWALMLPLLAAISYAFGGIYAKRFADLPALVTARGQLTFSALAMLPLALVHDQPWTLAMPSTQAILAVLALALLSTALGYMLYFRILNAAGATNASLVTLLIPPSAILLGMVFLGETLEPLQIAGMALIGFGLLLIDGRLFGGRRSRPG